MVSSTAVYVGIKGAVVALDRATGSVIWNAYLKGSDFVNVLVYENEVYATTKGELFCLDIGTGQLKWNNPLKGFGLGLASIALPGIQSGQAPLMRKRQQEQEAAAAAAAAASAS
jgi:outer membrane protein assembly factor BamB